MFSVIQLLKQHNTNIDTGLKTPILTKKLSEFDEAETNIKSENALPNSLPWSGKLLIVEPDYITSLNADYQDSNQNGIMDQDDQGWFAPGSTVKVAIALAALEVNGSREDIEMDLKSALVISDNQATNRLIDRIGGLEKLNILLKSRGFQHLIIGRYMGENQGIDPHCMEMGRLGNCATASDLILSLKAVVEGGIFKIQDEDRQWLKDILSLTPQQAGFDQPDDYCRFLKMPGLQKCGVSPFPPQYYSNLSYSPQHQAYILIAVEPPSGTREPVILDKMNEWVHAELEKLQLK